MNSSSTIPFSSKKHYNLPRNHILLEQMANQYQIDESRLKFISVITNQLNKCP